MLTVNPIHHDGSQQTKRQNSPSQLIDKIHRTIHSPVAIEYRSRSHREAHHPEIENAKIGQDFPKKFRNHNTGSMRKSASRFQNSSSM